MSRNDWATRTAVKNHWRNICVFTGSRQGSRSEYAEAAKELAQVLVDGEYGLVYGGGNVGLMTVIADAMLSLGGHVTGVIPDSLVSKEVAHPGLSDLRVVLSMHQRKALMAELADAFIALPGGIGTMEEFFEVLSWAQLGLHTKPCALLNVCGYYDPLIQFLDQAVASDFINPKHRGLLIVEREPARLMERIAALLRSQPAQPFDSRRS